jgi:hypothetical protein
MAILLIIRLLVPCVVVVVLVERQNGNVRVVVQVFIGVIIILIRRCVILMSVKCLVEIREGLMLFQRQETILLYRFGLEESIFQKMHREPMTQMMWFVMVK